MIYKLKFGSGGSIQSFKECSNPRLGNWVPTTKALGTINRTGGNTDWQVGSQHLIFESHHLSDIIKGLDLNFRNTQFLLPSSKGMVYLQHQYWQSADRQSTRTLMNLTRPGYRAMAEKAQHRHRIVLGTGAISGKGDWNVSCFGLMSITGALLASSIEGKKASLQHAGNINQDVAEEALAWGATIGGFFT